MSKKAFTSKTTLGSPLMICLLRNWRTQSEQVSLERKMALSRWPRMAKRSSRSIHSIQISLAKFYQESHLPQQAELMTRAVSSSAMTQSNWLANKLKANRASPSQRSKQTKRRAKKCQSSNRPSEIGIVDSRIHA